MDWKDRFWRYATGIVVVLILLSPEMIHLAAFIDTVGLELFVLLIEVQTIVIFCGFLVGPLKRLAASHGLKSSFQTFGERLRTLSILSLTPATLMHILVLSTVLGFAFNIHQ
jgi:uncharacterized membrane protein YkgB